MDISDNFGQLLRGDIWDSEFEWFSDTVNGTAAFPTWSAETALCSIQTFSGRCGKVVATLNGVPTPYVSVSGTLQEVWVDPSCTDTWTGTWEYGF